MKHELLQSYISLGGAQLSHDNNLSLFPNRVIQQVEIIFVKKEYNNAF